MYSDPFSLLRINEVNGGFYAGGGRRRGGGTSESGPGWSNKDDYGNSSIAVHNRLIRDRQVYDKTRDALRHDLHRKYDGDEARIKKALDEFDRDPQKQQEAFDKYRPDLSSNDRNSRDRAKRQEAKDDARQAVRDYVKEQEERTKAAGGDWTHEDAEQARKNFRNKQENNGESDSDDESKPITQDKAAEAEAAGTTDQTLTPDQRLTVLEQNFNAHILDPNAHHTPYYA